MADLDAMEIERYKYAKQKIAECDAAIENTLARIKDHEEFLEHYERIHKAESEFIALCEKKLALP